MPDISVLIPSRLARAKDGQLFLERAVQSIRGQAGHSMSMQILVGIDAGASAPDMPGVRFVHSQGRSQAAALNAAARHAEGNFIAILEDDDQWNPGFLFCAFALLKQDIDFCSSTQLEVTEDGKIVQISEYPIPSSWVMRRAIWDKVGLFNEEYRFHLDNEWLGRLGETDARRVHMVEATAPMDYALVAQSRPWLARLLENARPKVELARHDSPWPLIIRLCHPGSGMAQIKADASAKARSEEEMERVKLRFGRHPW